MKGGGKAPAVISTVIQLASIGMSLAALIITGKYLWYSMDAYYTIYYDTPYYPAGTTFYFNGPNLCLLSPLKSENMCAYSWAVAAVGIIFAIGAAGAMCNGAAAFACGAAVLLFNSVWWLAAAITLTVYGENANDSFSITIPALNKVVAVPGWPQKDYRVSIYAMAWAQFGINVVNLLLALGAKKSAGSSGSSNSHDYGFDEGKPPKDAYVSTQPGTVPPPPPNV